MQEKDTSLHTSPQLGFVEHNEGFAVALSQKQTISLYKKSKQSGVPFSILEEVYRRGFIEALELGEAADSYAFNRINSFIAGGAAAEMDKDLNEKRGLWDNIHAKRERIKHGSGEHMRKPGSKGAPTAAALKAAQESYTGAETVSADKDDPSSRFVGTDSIVNVYKNDTPGYEKQKSKTFEVVKKVVREQLEEDCGPCEGCTCGLSEDAKGYKNPTGGLTQKGRDHYNRTTGSHLKAPVTTPPSKLKKGSKAANRRKSFCARMGGVKGPMKDDKGRPTRKALALRKWNC